MLIELLFIYLFIEFQFIVLVSDKYTHTNQY